jgi:CBS domain-containing protein
MNLGKTLSEIQVKDIMTKQLISADPTTTLFQISKMMEQGVGAILVKKDAIPAGIITDRDFAIKVAANKMPLDTTVEKIASYPLKTISSDQSVLKASEIMSSQKIRKLAVSENGRIVGIITSTDIVNLISSNKIQ